MIKFCCDRLFALAGLILVCPILILCMVIIIFLDHQNPLFIQNRLGKLKQPFSIIKLRTMKSQKVTPFGNILRKTGIDELPQLINILIGHMSFVGPRPLTESDAIRLGWNDSFHNKRWEVRPGLTGLAQLSPVCNKKMSWFLDQKYISCQNFFLDLRILFSSMAVLFVGKKKAVKWIYNSRHEYSS